MTPAPRPWLPPNALRDAKLTDALRTEGDRWAAKWFTSPKPVSVRMNEVRGRSVAGDGACWRHPGGGLQLVMSSTAHVPIACSMLGLETGAQKLSAQDHALLREVAGACARDFILSTARLFCCDPAAQPAASLDATASLSFAFSLGPASQLLELFVDEDLAITARRALSSEDRRALAPLSDRREAIGRQSIDVGALIGTGKLGLGDLRTLAPGDLLVLDRGPADFVELAIDGTARPDTRCAIAEDGPVLRMRPIERELNGHP